MVLCGFLFCVSHAAVSTLMFYLVDCISRRYGSRSVYVVSGIFTLFPKLGWLCFFMVVIFGGIPGTLKFICEFYLFSMLFSFSCPVGLIVALAVGFAGLVGFSKAWFNAIFGLPSESAAKPRLDLSKRELLGVLCVILVLIVSSLGVLVL